MSVQTPITNSVYDVVSGSLRNQIAKFTSIADNDTFVSDLSVVVGFSVDPGNTAACGVTWVNASTGATLTFHIGSGPATNVSLVVWGF